MTQMTNDPVIDEIREVRHRISARFNHDPSKLVAYYMDLQERYSDRLIKEPESENRGSSEAREGKASSAQS